MSKGLEALKFISRFTNFQDGYYKDKLDSIEKELKALEIIKRLPEDYIKDLIMFIRGFPDETFGDFISWGGDETPILIEEEEFDFLREIFYGI